MSNYFCPHCKNLLIKSKQSVYSTFICLNCKTMNKQYLFDEELDLKNISTKLSTNEHVIVKIDYNKYGSSTIFDYSTTSDVMFVLSSISFPLKYITIQNVLTYEQIATSITEFIKTRRETKLVTIIDRTLQSRKALTATYTNDFTKGTKIIQDFSAKNKIPFIFK